MKPIKKKSATFGQFLFILIKKIAQADEVGTNDKKFLFKWLGPHQVTKVPERF